MAKNDDQKYWWIKLETDFFYQNAIDYLMSQKNGSEYVVLYQMLCLKTANTDGMFVSKIGDVVVKYDISKIQRDTKYFTIDTITVALNLFLKLGLVYENDYGFMKIDNHEKMTGYQTGAAKRMKDKRKNTVLSTGNIVGTNVPKSIELRDKSLENISKSIEGRVKEDKDSKEKETTPPTFEDIEKIYTSKKYKKFDISKFYHYHEARNWKFNNGKPITLSAVSSIMEIWESTEYENKNILNNQKSKVSVIRTPDWMDEYLDEIREMDRK